MLRSSESSKKLARTDRLSIGDVATRAGLAVSAIRFYEEKGLITAERSPSGHRQFRRSAIRRLSFIRICQKLGYSLSDIQAQFDKLPKRRNPTESDWHKLSSNFASDLDDRIAGLQKLRELLDGCIGCGCLSMEACALYNADDGASALGTGPRYLLGNSPTEVSFPT